MYNRLIEHTYFIIDFDSTFVSIESLDELAGIALTNNLQKQTLLKQITEITKQGMEGKIDYHESLAKRIALFKTNKQHIGKLIEILSGKITPSVARNKAFFKAHKDNIYIISGGFTDYILPIVKEFGIDKTHILANTFTFGKVGNVTGYDTTNPLAGKGGKSEAIKQLGLKGEIYIVGDGYTDFVVKKDGVAKKFFAFTENVFRKPVADLSDRVLKNFDEVLLYANMPRSVSYPPSRMNVLLLENIHPNAQMVLTKEGYNTTTLASSLNSEELIKKIQNISILGIGSRTQITKPVLDAAKKLLAIGRFGIGTNNIDLSECSLHGVAVFNAPFSNTRSVVELTLGEIILLYRRIFEKNEKMHKGIWDKTAKNCFELRDKTLGIIGYGNIGSQLSILAEAVGMKVIFYDLEDKLPLGNAKQCQMLDELLENAEVITLHVDGRKENTNFIGEEQFKKMREGVIFINTSRGQVVDISALAKYIKNGKILGAGCDVFPKEPKSNDEFFSSPLQGLANVVLTPHIGGRSLEAQAHMGNFVPDKIIKFINTGGTAISVNFPNLSLPEQKNTHRFIHIHKNIPGMLAQINSALAKHNVNIEGQYLKTNEQIGYVITDVASDHKEKVIKDLKSISGTIRFRELY